MPSSPKIYYNYDHLDPILRHTPFKSLRQSYHRCVFLRVGFAKVSMTPSIGIPMDGYALRTSPSKGIHDELYARALYVEHGNEAISMVVLDLLYITQDLLVRIRRAVRGY